MADEDHVPPNRNAWGQTQSLNLERFSSSFANQKTQLQEQDCSMVVIRDNSDCTVFPPVNHENLQPHRHHHIPIPQSPLSLSTSSSSFSSSSLSSSATSSLSSLSPFDADNWDPSSSSSSPFDSRVHKGGEFIGLMSTVLEILCSKLSAMVTSFRNRGAIWSTGPALLMSCWIIMRFWCWLRRRRSRRRRIFTPNENRLLNIIKEKDGRIAQLLHQIAQMNEILIDRHKALAAK